MKQFSLLLLALLLLKTNVSTAQNQIPMYGWQSYFSYNGAQYIVADGNKIIVASEIGLYSKDVITGEYELHNKVNGMNDVQPKILAFDPLSGSTLVAYANSNMDVWTGDQFIAIPYVKNIPTSGNKNIYNSIVRQGLAYVSTGQGIVVINMAKNEIKETYSLSNSSIPAVVKEIAFHQNYIYAATTTGIYRANINNPILQLYSNWEAVNTQRGYRGLVTFQNNLYASTDSTIYIYEADTLRALYFTSKGSISKLSPTVDNIFISEYSNINNVYMAKTMLLGKQNTIVDSILGGNPSNVIELAQGIIYQADIWEGLKKIQANSVVERYNPPGPKTSATFTTYAHNGDLWMAHGGYNIEKMESFFRWEGASAFANSQWKIYDNNFFNSSVQPDLSEVIKDPNDGTIYFSSFQNGLYSVKPDGTSTIINDTAKLGFNIRNGYPTIKTAGMAYDEDGNLWITSFGAQYELVCKTRDNVWYRYNVPLNRPPYTYSAGRIIIDDDNQKWYLAPMNNGVMVYDDNRTLDNKSDDRYKQLVQGKGFGNLPGSDALCLAKDKDGAIWIGTNNGIGIVNCPGDVLNNQCEAEIRIVQFDQFAGYLFEGKSIRSIAVDGANRKWVATPEGVWLLSPEGDKVIRQFSSTNSPLPSDNIAHIGIDAVTGIVYFSSEMGLVSYRNDATQGEETNESLTVFPNPVKSGYEGVISVKGLVPNALVSITDISGKLVYKSTATGGQIVWNGRDYTGRKPQSGIYLVFVTNKDGSQKKVGKIAFLE